MTKPTLETFNTMLEALEANDIAASELLAFVHLKNLIDTHKEYGGEWPLTSKQLAEVVQDSQDSTWREDLVDTVGQAMRELASKM